MLHAFRQTVALASSLAGVLGMLTAVEDGDTGAAPPRCPAVAESRSGPQTSAVDELNDRGTWDLRGAVWAENAPDPTDYPVRSDEWTGGCVWGGTIVGNVPKHWTRDQWYDDEDEGTRLGGEAFRISMTDTQDNFVVLRDSYVEDYEDAFDPNSPRADSTTYLLHVYARYIRDDCVENEDVPHNMLIRNSLLDGCFAAFAQRPKGSSTATDGGGPHWFRLEGSLVHVKPQPLGPNYCDAAREEDGRCMPTGREDVWLGAYGIWKWSDQAASSVTVRDTIFRLDMPSYATCQGQRWPAGTYENVTVVWTGAGPYSEAGGCTNTLPDGVTLTEDIRVWRRAKRAWLQDAAAGASTSGGAGTTAPSPTDEPTTDPEETC